MPRYAAFLRGINLGRRRVSNVELCAAFEGLGMTQVSAFLASGNVVFDTGRKQPAKLELELARGLEAALGYAVPTFLRAAAHVRTIADHQPFPGQAGGKLQVMMLAKPPATKTRKEILALATSDDRLAFNETELYWLPAGRMSDSALDLGRIEKTIGPTTTRTHQTMVRLVAKFLTD